MVSHADGFGLIQDIDVRLTVELGRKSMRLRDVLAVPPTENILCASVYLRVDCGVVFCS